MSGTVTTGSPIITNLFGDPAQVAAYAAEMIDDTQDYVRDLRLVTQDLVPPVIDPNFPEPDAAPAPITTSPPSMQAVVWTAPAPPASFSRALDIGSFLPAPFDDDPPSLIFPGAPDSFGEAIPAAPGIDTTYVMPDLTVSLPAAPSLLSLTTYAFGGVTVPTFTEEAPTLTLVAPSVREYTPGAAYTSGLLSAVQAELQDRIVNGGTGLNPDVEQAIWDRAREREARANAVALADLERMETLGYTFPPGVYVDARLKIATETAYTAAGLSRDIAIKQAELEMQNVVQALQQATTLEGTLINYANAVEQRLFDSAKYATEAGIAIYNAGVQAYIAYVDTYKAKVAAYEAQIRGELAKVEAYRAQIAAEEAKAQINTALVQQYRVQADVALSAIEIFKAQVGAIQARADIEKLKVMIFGEQVRAYSAQVNAYTAGVEGYRASIQAEGVKQEAYRTSVQAYTAQVEAGVKQADAKIEEFKALLGEKTQQWDAYRAAYAAEAERARAITATNSTATEAYRATIAGTSAYNELLTKQWQVSLDQAQRVAEIGVAAAKTNAELYMTTRSLALDAAKVGASVSAQLGAAALNAVHWSQSYSGSQSESSSLSVSYSYSASV